MIQCMHAKTMTLSTKDPSWFSVASSAKPLLVAAAQTWEDTDVSEQYIQQALAEPDVELDTLVSAYRYFFYKNNNAEALEIAIAVCDSASADLSVRIRKDEQWPTDWEDLKPLFLDQLDDAMVRLYLSAYNASGLLLARLGKLEIAQQIANQVQQIEAKEFGGEFLLNILNSPADEDEDD